MGFPKNYVDITDAEIKRILETKEALLFKDKKPWRKKGGKPFNVTMGSWDGAEVADLVGLYLLSKLSVLGLDIGLYRDDGLAVLRLRPRQAEMTKKKLCSIFKEHGLSVTASVNLKSVNFLDVNFNLETGLYRPYMKPNDTPTYVHKDSNHPKSVLKNIPLAVNRRLSSISANEEVFKSAIPPYQEALKKSGYDHKLVYEPTIPQGRRKNRPRKIVWFNPPFSSNVQTNIGAKFLSLLDKHFPHGHPLHKVINRNNVKMSYRCMPNLKQKINMHNRRVQSQNQPMDPPGCNCTGGIQDCPLDGNCKIKEVIYQAEVSGEGLDTETYTGLTSQSFKKRYYGHTSSFTHRDSTTSTTLSSYIWDLKDLNCDFNIKWSVIDRGKPFNPVTRRCNLCTLEKYHIIFQPEGATLNKRSELFSACRHRKKDLLCNI